MKKTLIFASYILLAAAVLVTSVFIFNKKTVTPSHTGEYTLSGETEIIMQLGSPRTLVNNILKLIDPADGRIIPMVENGTTMVPLRFIGEALNAQVKWNEAANTAILTYAGKPISVTPGSTTMKLGDKSVELEVPVMAVGGRILVPARKICEAAGLNVVFRDGQILISEVKMNISDNGTIALLDNALPKISNLKTASSADGLLKMFKDNIALASKNGLLYNGFILKGTASQTAALAPVARDTMSAESGSSGGDYSQTNVQVQGVDEADNVKTDGNFIYKISDYDVVIIDAAPAAEMKVVSQINYANNEFQPLEMYVDGKYLTVIGNYYTDIVPINQPPILEDTAPAPGSAGKSGAVITGNSGSGSSSSGSSGEATAPVPPESGAIAQPAITILPGDQSKIGMPYYPYNYSYSRIYVYDISDKANVKMVRYCDVDGGYVTSRKIGSSVYLVANKYNYYSADQLTKESIIPIYRDSTVTGDELKPMPIENIYYFGETFSPGYMVIAGLNLDNPDQALNVNSYLGSGMTVYASLENLYVSYADYNYGDVQIMTDSNTGVKTDIAIQPSNFTVNTKIFKFSLKDGAAIYLSKGEVPGTLLNQFSMDEFSGGNFRVATTNQGTFTKAGVSNMTNNVYVLDYALNTIGKIEDIAPGERIYSVRFLGARGYMVTYKTVDPLFVLDFTVPAEPKILGQLKIPGFSDYLHPYDENHIIGFGKDTTETVEGRALMQGLKVAIFDVTDPANPVEEFKMSIGDRGTYSELLTNHKALLFSISKNLLVFPVNLFEIPNKGIYTEKELAGQYGLFKYQGAYVYSIDANMQMTLKGRITHMTADDMLKAGNYEGDYNKYVSRALYIGDTLYTISNTIVKANAISDLSEIATLKYK